MRFSVIIPLFNKAPYVKKAIESVLAQTWRDFELVVVDDGSSDESYAVAEAVLKGSPIPYQLIHQKNAGVSTARNNGVKASHGDYLCFLDADDWWDASFLEEMNELVSDFPDAGIYGSNYTIVNERKQKTRIAKIGVEDDFVKGDIDYCMVYAKTLQMPLWTGAVCIPRMIFEVTQGFKPQLKMGEDFDLWIRIALKYRVVFLNKPLAFYNQDVDASHRAIGSLPPPETQFAFCTDYLKDDMQQSFELKHLIEIIQIVCLRNYYLSKAYHERAKEALAGVDLLSHKGQTYAMYLSMPLWMARLKQNAIGLLNRLRYGD